MANRRVKKTGKNSIIHVDSFDTYRKHVDMNKIFRHIFGSILRLLLYIRENTFV